MTEWPGACRPSSSYTWGWGGSFSSPSTYKCNPMETYILRRCCAPSTYLMDGVTSGNPFVSGLALSPRETEQIQLQEVSMGSTMGSYKYTGRGFSTHLHTEHSCTDKQSVLAQMNVRIRSPCSRGRHAAPGYSTYYTWIFATFLLTYISIKKL